MSATLDLFGRMASSDPAPRAQLTVFYSGTVNVYDDIPADKAHAIMLLLHSNKSNPATLSMVSNEHLTPSVNPKDSDPVPSPCDTSVITSSMISRASSNSSLRDLIQPLSRCSAPPSPLPSSPFSAPQTDKKQQIVCKRSQAELPFARKASLARFLEKRKDRVQPKLEQEDANHLEKKMKPTTESMPR